MSRAVAGALLAAAAALACAQPGRPPGGEVDRSPPRVIATWPMAFDTITDLTRPVVITFDERLSIRYQNVTDLREAVLVSPTKGVPIVDRGRRRITVRLAGGWEPDQVYRVVILPVYRDLFGNQRQDPVDLVFSTGARITESALAGFVTDRLTGRPVADARVQATRRIDDQHYVAVTDTGGFFALRYVPAGAYDLESWVDQDRDVEPDFFEAQDSTDTAFGVGDTAVVEMAVLPMDTTPARLARAEVVDSSKVRLVFDDYFAPGPVAGEARLYLMPDSTLVTASGRLIHETRLDSVLAMEQAEAARQDSIRAAEALSESLRALEDSLNALPDSLQPPPDSVRAIVARLRGEPLATDSAAAAEGAAGAEGVGPPLERRPGRPGREQPGRSSVQPQRGQRDQGPRGAGREAEEPLPSRNLILLLPGVLNPDTTYLVEVEGVVNIRGVAGGGGAAPFRAPAAPDTTAADSAAAAEPDSAMGAGAAPARDTVPPDTVPPDTVPPPDSIPWPGRPR